MEHKDLSKIGTFYSMPKNTIKDDLNFPVGVIEALNKMPYRERCSYEEQILKIFNYKISNMKKIIALLKFVSKIVISYEICSLVRHPAEGIHKKTDEDHEKWLSDSLTQMKETQKVLIEELHKMNNSMSFDEWWVLYNRGKLYM